MAEASWGYRVAVMALAALAPFRSGTGADVEISTLSGDVDNPRHHFRLRNPANLSPQETGRIYDIIRGALAAGYPASGLPAATSYQQWRRYNTAPYLSTTHGNKYLNNYANAAAAAYGEFEQAGKLPVGSIIAKDSFAVAESGEILLGPLYVMEKMPEGFNYVTGDWKYIQIQPDGKLFGETKGQGADKVEYCVACHLVRQANDHLYFIPEGYRLEAP
ncbi:MAG: cytochrome P460 family protein [Gammaproteobacteria bacterium]